MDLRRANLVPERAATPEQARALVALDGAALVSGIGSADEAVAFGSAMLGSRAIRVRPQFEATKAEMDVSGAIVAAQPVDSRGRKRDYGRYDEIQPPHNDGFGFGDLAPDYMFLYCEQPCSKGGASFLIDALKLLTLVGADDAELARFCWDTPIDHSEPNFPQGNFSPIARQVPGGRAQVRCHPYLAPILGPDEAEHAPFVQRWTDAVIEARDSGPRFRVAAGDVICIDNYRMLHGREAFVDVDRKVVSIWAWSVDAVSVPDHVLDIATPMIPEVAAAN